ncbi:MAG: hypothetical protein LBH32_08705 [Dysgonamonadaceae bacterium]|jgi:hypothetical protein|nr:hypothetical protein [Dysgonamonadaceae bacterium]
MTRQFFRFLGCTVLVAMLLTGCKNEELLLDDGVPMEKGKLSFILPLGGNQTVTYASIPGDSLENELKNVKIFMFRPSDGKLDAVFSWPTASGNEIQVGMTASGANRVVTLPTGSATLGVYRFYILANVNGSAGITAASIVENGQGGAILSVTHQDEFEKVVSDELAKVGNDLTLIGCPLPMSVAKNSANNNLNYIELNPSTTQVATAHLSRRVARFDIINHSDFSNFKIEKVYITDASAKGYLNDGQKDTTFVLGSTQIDLSATANGTPIPVDSLLDDASMGFGIANNDTLDFFDAGKRDPMQLNKSQFYLYPTVLKFDGTKKGVTELVFEGTYDRRETRTYKVELTEDLPILANHVYRIAVKRIVEQNSKITLTVSEWEWDPEDTLTVNRDLTPITFGHIKLTDPSQGTFINGGDSSNISLKDTIYYTSDTPTEVKIKTSGYTVNGIAGSGHTSMVSIVPPAATYGYLSEDIDAVRTAPVSSSTINTYGLVYETTHTIQLPPTVAPIAFEVIVSSATITARKKHYYIVSENYNKLGFKPVKFTYTDAASAERTILFAPVNVGATVSDTTATTITTEIGGYRYQWGRNYGWDVGVTIASQNMVTGPLATIADTVNCPGKFIQTPGSDGADWLTAHDNDLWGAVSGDPKKMQGPCPNGWRIPTEEIMAAAWVKRAWKGKALALTLDDGKRIVLQPGGYSSNNGASSYTSQRGYYWTITPGTVTPSKSFYARVASDDTGGTTQSPGVEDYRVYGYNIRAVRDYIPLPNFQ